MGVHLLTASFMRSQVLRSVLKLSVPVTTSSQHIHIYHKEHRIGERKRKNKPPYIQRVKEVAKEFGPQLSMLKDEISYYAHQDHLWGLPQHGDYETIWRFNTQDEVDGWWTTADSDNNVGKSTASMSLTANNTGLFSGYINTEVPDDGKTAYTGYASIKSPWKLMSFYRIDNYNWEDYSHLLIRYRGDGRAYQLVFSIDGEFDVQWGDQYQYILFTRGGPYWQIAKIPFSKFFLVSHGRVQDKQATLHTASDLIRYVAITMADGNLGPFHLELDFIAVARDDSDTEKFAYEMYQVKRGETY